MIRRMSFMMILACALGFALLGHASAHADVASSTPAAGARLTAAPSEVVIVLTEEIDAAKSTFVVTNASGATVGTGKLDTDDLDHKTLRGALNSGLGNGVYTVKWTAVTTDDDGETTGSFTFGVNADTTATAAPAATTAATAAATTAAAATSAASATAVAATLPATGGESSVVWFALLGAAALLLIGGLLLRQRSA